MWMLGGALALAVTATMPAGAQNSDFEQEVLRRIERLERRIDDLERENRRGDARGYRSRDEGQRNGGQRTEVTAAVSLLCGADCGMAARSYCQRTGFGNGVAITIEKKGMFDHVTRARCFN